MRGKSTCGNIWSLKFASRPQLNDGQWYWWHCGENPPATTFEASPTAFTASSTASTTFFLTSTSLKVSLPSPLSLILSLRLFLIQSIPFTLSLLLVPCSEEMQCPPSSSLMCWCCRLLLPSGKFSPAAATMFSSVSPPLLLDSLKNNH